MNLTVTPADLKGLYLINLVVHEDSRGSFREAFHAQNLEALGLPRLNPVQWNISENLRRGIVRGIHAEPWDKYAHVITGEVFAVIVDLRPDSITFKQVRTFTLDETKALFISRGLGNAYQVLSNGAVYGYLVNAHWQPGISYPSIAYNDPTLAINWPLPVGPDDVSEKDKQNPRLSEIFSLQKM
ncbi:MAG: dTDP-4-dehydrorhamnose 3,5-epimerase family protein [Candidatus Kerfeldbacteria bacterium]|nr:dTDP-4-dehydrorhamnose 3,5-epimerase family protein [Candidatus Kerfeldbacteria bacterium]